jgi:archaellum component FlaD/FlaE
MGNRSGAFQELNALQRASPRGHVDKPYLARMPDAYETQVSMMRWIESLIMKTGREGTLDAISYYRSIGWITGEVERTLKEHARTIAESTANGSVELTMEDHRESLTVIAQLAHSHQLQSRPRTPPRRQRR